MQLKKITYKNKLGLITNLNSKNCVKLTCLTVRLKLVKELKSTVSGREFQHVVTRSLKTFARTLCVLTLTELEFMPMCDLTRTKNKQIFQVD